MNCNKEIIDELEQLEFNEELIERDEMTSERLIEGFKDIILVQQKKNLGMLNKIEEIHIQSFMNLRAEEGESEDDFLGKLYSYYYCKIRELMELGEDVRV